VLRESGFIQTIDTEQRFKADVIKFAESKKRIRPTTFFITTSINCAQACTYCFESDARSISQLPDTKTRIYPEEIQNIGRTVNEYIELRQIPPELITLVLFGGDPLLQALPL